MDAQSTKAKASRLLNNLAKHNLDQVAPKLLRLAQCEGGTSASCWNLETAPVVLSRSFDTALAHLSADQFAQYLALWQLFIDYEEAHWKLHHKKTGTTEVWQVQQWLVEECQAYWADMVDDMSRHAVPPLVELCGRFLAGATGGQRINISAAPLPEELKQRLALQPWRLQALTVREERLAQDELFGRRWLWNRQHRRLEWVDLCGRMAKLGIVPVRLSVDALRSLLLAIRHLHELLLRAKGREASAVATPTDDEGGLPGRGEVEVRIQRIEEETLDLVLVLLALHRGHVAAWKHLMTTNRPDQAGETRRSLEASLRYMTTLAQDPRFCDRAQPVLVEATQLSSPLLATVQPHKQ
ncbi:uncharacterized protein ACA1_171750 [Acanthamoeba castellanii str. Neff]|uniref:Uncharacterized protein n=1 Tax=Acanthamoeba castellanii (strain ATCC 30010 / Neff) TaxID=1257118 RepID=L8HJQ5_ACACF|nr:uncharacterized protein ACA1_171750 [Acanthamoeba castellanii str. Neff]ELR24591.1 hypothetical protein ACA1_171750 [Acanthamoeba castellanii str. Neff]